MRFRIVMLFVALLLPLVAHGQFNFVVPNAVYPTIQSAIDASQPGDRILVWPGTYVENLVWPPHDIELIGSGIGQTIVDGGGLGPCVSFIGGSSGASLLEGFSLRNGLGAPANYGVASTAGGGLYLVDDASGLPEPVIRQCEISGCRAQQAPAVYMWNAGSVLLEDLIIQLNLELPSTMGPNEVSGIEISESNTSVTMRRTVMQGNHSSGANSFSSLIRVKNGASLSMEDCDLRRHKLNGALIRINAADVVELDRCMLRLNYLSGTIMDGFANGIEIRDSLIYGNAGGSGMIFNSPCSITGCTIAGNTGLVGAIAPGPAVLWGVSLDLRNTIIWGNLDATGNTPLVAVQGTAFVHHCDIEAGGGIGTLTIDADPLFADATTGDYRILPGSPCIDGGDSSIPGGLGPTDIRGENRVLLSEVDMGCYEGREMAHHPAAAGRVGEAFGGPYDVLLVNGSTGGPYRTVNASLGSTSTVSMLQPQHLAFPAGFVIYGFLGQAGLNEITHVPLGIGDMMFTPEPMVLPGFGASHFTYTNNLAPNDPQMVTSTLTSWTSGVGPIINFPLTITFQGILQEQPGVFRPTNAIQFNVQ